MKITLQIVLTGIFFMTGYSTQAFAQAECPVLAGHYEDGDKTMSIFENRIGSLYRVTLGEGAFEITVDGSIQLSPDGVVQYQASCQQGALTVNVSAGGQTGIMKYYFMNPQTLVEENSGFENFTRHWKKK